MKHLMRRNEFFLGITIVLICVVFGFANKAFFTVGNFIDLLQSGVEMGIFALGALIVIISGGIDVSFTAISIFAFYVTTLITSSVPFLQGNVLWAFLLAVCMGALLGLVNAALIGYLRLPTLIVTLGTMGLFQGAMLVFFGTDTITNLPRGMMSFSQSQLFHISTKSGNIGLATYFVLLVAAAVVVSVLLKYTILGRGIYALGGDSVAAQRVGFNRITLQIFIYCFVGFLAGLVGIVHGAIVQSANPFDLVGTELSVIAAVVIGGARITGGHGNVIGTLLGVLLVDIINNSLVLLGIPSYSQQAIIGLLILIGTGVTANQSRRDVEVNLMGS